MSDSIRNFLSEEGKEHFDDIVLMRKLGASPNIKAIGCMFADMANHAKDNGLSCKDLIERVKTLSEFFIELRGESSFAIVTAISLMLRNIDDYSDKGLDAVTEFLKAAHRGFQRTNEMWMSKIREFGANILADKKSMLVFDYSSTVAAMMQTAQEHGMSMDVFIPESRALDGGRPFVSDAIRFGHRPHFFPDSAIDSFVKRSDVCFAGAETIFPDGSAKNTVGSNMVAFLCHRYKKGFYIPTTLLKVNPRSISGQKKTELERDLSEQLAANWDEETRSKTSFLCPDLDIIEAENITGFITEEGVIPPYAMFGVCQNFIKSIEV